MVAKAETATAAASKKFAFGLLVATLALASCGGEDGGQPSAAVSAPVPGTPSSAPGSVTSTGSPNRPPAIRGVPQASIASGHGYSFTPTASDPESQRLTFSVTNLPKWASFSTATGELRGTPGPADVGSYQNIRIIVSDGIYAVSLSPFKIDVLGTATGSITLSWYAPTERTDGSPLHDLSGYKIYWGTSHGTYPNTVTIDHPGIATYVIEHLTPGTYYLVATAFDAAGVESEFSGVLSAVVR